MEQMILEILFILELSLRLNFQYAFPEMAKFIYQEMKETLPKDMR
jgi:hypothetical protein